MLVPLKQNLSLTNSVHGNTGKFTSVSPIKYDQVKTTMRAFWQNHRKKSDCTLQLTPSCTLKRDPLYKLI